jgi:hypothetical protein
MITAAALIGAGFGIAVVSASTAALNHPIKTLYSFTGAPDGASPNGDLIVDDGGVYYGNTALGGVITTDCPSGCGTVYNIVNGEESVIYRFLGGSDGAVPYDGLFRDAEGNLYGVTRVGATATWAPYSRSAKTEARPLSILSSPGPKMAIIRIGT